MGGRWCWLADDGCACHFPVPPESWGTVTPASRAELLVRLLPYSSVSQGGFGGLVCGMSLPFWLCLKGTRKFSSFVTGDWTLQEWGSIWNCSRSSKKWVSIYILDCKTEHIHLWSQSKILQIIKLDIILFRFTLTSFTIVSLWWQIVSNEVYSWLGYALSHALKKKWINICIRKSGIICWVFVISLD